MSLEGLVAYDESYTRRRFAITKFVWSMQRCLWAKCGAPWYWLRLCSFLLESFGLGIFTTANGSSAMFINRHRGNAFEHIVYIHLPVYTHTVSRVHCVH